MEDTLTCYHLVEWINEEEEEEEENEVTKPSIGIVPDKWLVVGTNQCRWPRNVSSQKIRRNPSPAPSWATYSYLKIVKSTTDWNKVKKWEKKYAVKTDLDTTDDEMTKRRTSLAKNGDKSRSQSPRSPTPPPCSQQSRTPLSVQTSNAFRGGVSSIPPPPAAAEQNTPFRCASRTTQRAAPAGRGSGRNRSRSPLSRSPAPTHQASGSGCDYRPYFEAILRKQEQILASVTSMKTDMEKLKKDVSLLMSASELQAKDNTTRPELPQGFEFPLLCKQELERLNIELADDSLRQRLECHLSNLGGKDYRDSLRAAGALLMAPKLQGEYNLTGSTKSGQQKAAFCRLTSLNKALFNAVFDRHQNDRKTFNTYLSDWLSTWRDRLEGGRKNRIGAQKKLQGEQNES